MRAQVRYVERHRKRDDVVVVSYAAAWGVAYYAEEGAPLRRGPGTLYEVRFAAPENILTMDGRTPGDIDRTMRARVVSNAVPASTIWIIQSTSPRPNGSPGRRCCRERPSNSHRWVPSHS